MATLGLEVVEVGVAWACASSVLKAGSDAAQKGLSQRLPQAELAAGIRSGMIAVTFIGAFLYQEGAEGIQTIRKVTQSYDFLQAWAISGVVNAVAALLYQHGLSIGQLGDTLPYLSLTSTFLLLSEILLLGDSPTHGAIVGTLMISIAGFWLSRVSTASTASSDKEKGAARGAPGLPPGTAIFIFVAAIYSISSTFDKRGVKAAPPLVYGASISATISAGSLLLQLVKKCAGRGATCKDESSKGSGFPWATVRWLVLVYVLNMTSYVAQLEAAKRTHASTVSSIRRAGTLVAVVMGKVCFDEPIAQKFLPVSIMVLGVCLVAG